MIDGTYAIQVDTPLGRKPGRVDLHTEGNVVHATIDAPVIGRVKTDATLHGNSFVCEGSLKARLLGKVDYKLVGEVEGDGITIRIDSNKGQLDLTGTRV